MSCKIIWSFVYVVTRHHYRDYVNKVEDRFENVYGSFKYLSQTVSVNITNKKLFYHFSSIRVNFL